jgi:hypothetical protein
MALLEEEVNTMAPERSEVEALAEIKKVCTLEAVVFDAVSVIQEGIDVTEYVKFVVTVTLIEPPAQSAVKSVSESSKTSGSFPACVTDIVLETVLSPVPALTVTVAVRESVDAFAETETVNEPFPVPLEGEIVHQSLSLEAVQA